MVACVHVLHLKSSLLVPDLLQLPADCSQACLAFMSKTAAIAGVLSHRWLCTKRAADL